MRTSAILAAIGALAATLPAGGALAAGCTLGNAVYRPVEESDAVIRFMPPGPTAHTDYAMRLEFPSTGKAYDFAFTFSNGYSRQYALLVLPDEEENAEADGGADDEADMAADLPSSTISFFDAALRRMEDVSLGGPAPDYLILPDLGTGLWYGSPDGDRDNIPPEGMWRATCR